MTIQQDNQQDNPEGGGQWEVGKAADLLARVVGNEDAGEAVRSIVAGTVNQTIAQMSPSFTKTFSLVLENTLRDALGDVRAKLDTTGNTTAAIAQVVAMLDTRQTNSDRADLLWRADLRTHLDARFDNYGVELDGIAALTKELSAGVTSLRAGFSDLTEDVNQRFSDLDLLIAEIRRQAEERNADIHKRFDTQSTKINQHRAVLDELQATAARLDRRLEEMHHQMLGDELSREKRLELTANNESVPDLWALARANERSTQANTAAIEQLQKDVQTIMRLLSELRQPPTQAAA